MKRYDYVYIVCYFSGSKRERTLKSHLDFLNRYFYLKNKEVLFIVSFRGQDKQTLSFIKELLDFAAPNITVQIMEYPNWGMLVGSLWDAWKYLKKENIVSDYVIACEDDWIFNHWPQREALLDQGYTYVGMFSYLAFEKDSKYYNEVVKRGYKWKTIPQTKAANQWRRQIKKYPNEFNPKEKTWTDGGLYYFKYKSLQEIENKIGIFTKAPNDFNYGIHGVDYGEVGFPTELYWNGFRFFGYVGDCNEKTKCHTQIHLTGSSIITSNFINDEIF